MALEERQEAKVFEIMGRLFADSQATLAQYREMTTAFHNADQQRQTWMQLATDRMQEIERQKNEIEFRDSIIENLDKKLEPKRRGRPPKNG